jgi:uncharacterized protein
MRVPQGAVTIADEEAGAYWAALTTRDARFDGVFYYGVSTTGIYCRPSCPSPRPRRAHVSFHASTHAAEQAGLRACRRCQPQAMASDLGSRLEAIDWHESGAQLERCGAVRIPQLLTSAECRTLRARYADPTQFRARIVMSRHGFGSGEYQYFNYPLPPPLAGLRSACYRPLLPIANRWRAALGVPERFPQSHAQFLQSCWAAGQNRPTPLLLRYRAGDYNCLHQDLYGSCVFPLQLTILLSRPGEEFGGGEFVLTEQRPRRQSRVQVVALEQGDAVLFAVRERPLRGARGAYRVQMRHGVSAVTAGERFTLGVIFHDAQ